MPLGTGSADADAENNSSLSSGKCEGYIADGEAGDSVVGVAGAGVVASCPTAYRCPGSRTTQTVANRTMHKATDATSEAMHALPKRELGRSSSGMRCISCGP